MSRTDDRKGEKVPDKTPGRPKSKLPVTGEVGSEGGSYADSTLQVAHSEGDVEYLPEDSEPDNIESGPEDVIKYPSER